MATDITTRSALQRARAKASIITTFTLSDVKNSRKLGACNLSPPSAKKLESPEEIRDFPANNGGNPWRSLIKGEIGEGAPAKKGGRIERLVIEGGVD